MPNRFVRTLFVICLIASPAWAVDLSTSHFSRSYSLAALGWVRSSNRDFIKIGLSPDFNWGPVELGVDATLYSPLGSDPSIPNELQPFNFRYMSYRHNDDWKIGWGRLFNVTYGYGLLLNAYDSGNFGSSEFITRKAGTEVMINSGPVGVMAFYTGTDVLGIRSEYQLHPFVIGATFVQDSTGVFDPDTPSVLVRLPQSAYSADIGLPLFAGGPALFTEYGRLVNQSDGLALGIFGSGFIRYRAEYQILQARFVPGYFNSVYENYNAPLFRFSVDAPASAYRGWHLWTLTDLGWVNLGAEYWAYEGFQSILSGSVSWQRIGSWAGSVNYYRTFIPGTYPVLTADVIYYDFPGVPFPADATIRARREYISDTTFIESYTVEVQPNLSKIFGISF